MTKTTKCSKTTQTLQAKELTIDNKQRQIKATNMNKTETELGCY